ncbi:hypothetical protein CSOJ01_14867 [Colletotrichum sojae]|uniref:Protein kinase domain-containing protein n=1 Tax=Colletotrichum sojae TaxID=2175907 RepID=A0A8H6IPC2_9PEZI|nr:hypothetical protein CSOJ01_14867 [Colletotrichum sojae]
MKCVSMAPGKFRAAEGDRITSRRAAKTGAWLASSPSGWKAREQAELEGFEKPLSRLHGLGIKLSNIKRHNFLVRDGHGVVLVDFESGEARLPDPGARGRDECPREKSESFVLTNWDRPALL